MKSIRVIYHDNCADGFASAWTCWEKFGDKAKYTAAKYGQNPPDVSGQIVYIVDFSYGRDQIIEMAGQAKEITILDHHKTAIENLVDMDNIDNLSMTLDKSRSGCGITWDHFFGKRPWLIDYIEDRDIWNWNLEGSKEVNSYVKIMPRDFAHWSKVNKEVTLSDAIREGAAALRMEENYIESIRGNVRFMFFEGVRCGVVNMQPWGASEALHTILEKNQDIDFAVGWYQRSGGGYSYSLRSRQGFDVEEIAGKFGGGGHAQAAGFGLNEPPDRIFDEDSVDDLSEGKYDKD